jgi:hypothetical protein
MADKLILRKEFKLIKDIFMNKKALFISLVLLVVFAIGTVFADEILQCKDPKDGKVKITFMGDLVRASYEGKSAQTFDVLVLLKDGTTQKLSFKFTKSSYDQERFQTKEAKGPIEKITKCDFTSY